MSLLNGVIKENQREMKRKFTQKIREENLKGVNNWIEKELEVQSKQGKKWPGYIGGFVNAVSTAVYGKECSNNTEEEDDDDFTTSYCLEAVLNEEFKIDPTYFNS